MTVLAVRDDPMDPDVIAFLAEHLAEMRRTSPPESVHALSPAALAKEGIAFWTVRERGLPIGCAALAPLGEDAGELKSMRTALSARGRGIARVLLDAIVEEARRRGYAQVLLETGTEPYFTAARRLYERYGFQGCPPFGGYREDPHSTYYRLDLEPGMAEEPSRF
ncbi:MAG: GNAT family N-acetyltransferase [Amnibacterium sp.]